MSNFKTISRKLEQFIKKYYTNKLLKGTILFFTVGMLYLLATLFIEHMLWLNPTARTFLFWSFIAVELTLFINFIIFPVLHLFKLKQGINHEKASQLIGNHFPEVNDKLLNVIQLNKSKEQTGLLIASIDQKAKDLQPIQFKYAINFKANVKYLKYAAIPVLILLVSYITGKTNWFNDSYKRVVNYQTAYQPPAPFQFFVLNEKLLATENKDFKLNISTVGAVIPESVQIQYNNQTYFLKSVAPGEFQYTFNLPKATTTFTLLANNVVSKPYILNVLATPNLVNFEMLLDYPNYINKPNEVLKSTGSATIPEGTKVTWKAKTKATSQVLIYAKDTLLFETLEPNVFIASKQLYNTYNYNITTSNKNLKDYENLAFSIAIIKDAYPQLNINVQQDSIDGQSLYFYGQATDDYGLKKLQLVYYPANDESNKTAIPISITKANFSDFISAFPNQLNLDEGVSYNLYFQVFDNDQLHNYKRTKSIEYNYRKLTKEEKAKKELNQQKETIKSITNTFDKLDEQDKNLEEFSKTQKEKERLNFNDKKKFNEFLKRQKEQEQLMKNFNKKLQDNLEEFQNEKQDEFKEDLKQRLNENEEQLKKDQKLLKELEKLSEKINKEEFSQKLEELAKQNKNKKRNMKQLLELTKRFYVAKKTEKIKQQLENLAEKQEALSEKEKENTKTAQEELNKKFDELKNDLDELSKDNRQLQKPINIPRDKPLEDMVKYDQDKAKEELKNKEKSETQQKPNQAKEQQQKAAKKQKQAAKKIKEISDKLKSPSGSGSGSQTAEDIETLRQILDNLLLYSFEQESLMNLFKTININNNNYGKYIVNQNTLKSHFQHIDDSLFTLSLRQPKISNKVNTQINNVYFNLDKSLNQLSENSLYQAVSSQQYAITASNDLASMLSDILDNMEMSMQPSPGSGEGDMQLPDIIMSQEALNKKMEDALKKDEQDEQGNKGKKGEQGEEGKDGKKGENGDQGKERESGKQGEIGSQGEDGNNGKGGNNKGNSNANNGKQNNDKNKGYGEGGNEEQNGELFKIYQQQQLLRQALENRISKNETIQSSGELIKQMEDIELDLLNTGFTNQTLQKMMDLQHQLLKLDNATFMQGEDSKRKSETNTKEFNDNNQNLIPKVKQYFNTTEILNRQALPLQNHFKKKIKTYFNTIDD